MKDPRRLIEGHPHDLTGELISAWRTQRATQRSRARTAQAIGLSASVIAAAQAAGAATGVTAAAATGATAATGGAAGNAATVSAVILKWLVGGLLATSAVTVTVHRVIEATSRPRGATSTDVRSVRHSPARATHEFGTKPSVGAADTVRDRLAESPARQHEGPVRANGSLRSARSGDTATSSSPSSLAREVAVLEVVRRSLANRDARAALQALDEYRTLEPSGTLAPEAALLRIDALLLAGDSARAARLAGSYLAQYPRTPHATRLRRLAETGEPGQADATP
jgi:hypothetical protein